MYNTSNNSYANADGDVGIIVREFSKAGSAYPVGTIINGSVFPNKITVMNADGSDVQSYYFVKTQLDNRDVFIPVIDLVDFPASLTGSLKNRWKVTKNNVFPWIPSTSFNNPNVATSTLGPKNKALLNLQDIGSATFQQTPDGKRLDKDGNVVDDKGNIIQYAPGNEPAKKSIGQIIKQLPRTLFYSRETGQISYPKVAGVLAAATALGFGIKYLAKKFNK